MKSEKGKWSASPFLKLIIAILCILFLSSYLFYQIELKSLGIKGFFSAIWWSVVTLTTVGYGDIVPKTILGRVLGLVVMISGIGLVSTLTGNMASFLVEQKAKKRKGLLKLSLKDHYVFIGWNEGGYSIIRSLPPKNTVIAADITQEQFDEIKFRLDLDDQLFFVKGDQASESVLARANPKSAAAIFVLADDNAPPHTADQNSLYSILTIRSLAPKTPVYAELISPENRDHLLRAGANEVISRGESSASLLALLGHSSNYYLFFKQLTSLSDAGILGQRKISFLEKNKTWQEVFNTLLTEHILPVALCRQKKEIYLQDILNETSALDKFIVDLFAAAGKETKLGAGGPTIVINPKPDTSLKDFDTILYFKSH